MLRDSGTTRLNVVPNPSAPQADPFLKAVQDAAAGDFSVLGEIGRGSDGVIIYLAREASSGRLVALKLQRDGHLADEFTLEVVRHLDNSMPAPESKCFKCGKPIRGWARFCSYCGADLSGAAPAEGTNADRAAMLDAVREAVAADYEVLGEMSRNEGGGAVYFARDLATNKIVALRLQREGPGDEFSLGLTTAMKPLAASLGVKPVATQVLGAIAQPPAPAAVPPPAPSNPPASRPVAPPAAASAPPPLPPRVPISRRKKLVVAGGMAVVLAAALIVFTLPRQEAAPPTPLAPPDSTAVHVPPAPVTPAATADTAKPKPSVAAAPVEPHPPVDTPKDATVELTGLPPGAEVRVDGRIRVGRSLNVPAGRHAFTVSVAGYQPRTDTLRLRSGETIRWSPALSVETPKVVRAAAETSKVAAAGCDQSVKDQKWTVAFESCMREALGGSATAKRHLALLYEKGRGISRSDEDAARWYQSAATAGDRESMYQLGMYYERGRGVKKDQATALQWYTRAADAGQVDAQMLVADAYEKGHLGAAKDKARALDYFRKAAAQGNKDAANKVQDLSK